MPKISNKYYRRAKPNTDALINSVKFNEEFDQCLNRNNDMNINEQLNCIELDYNNFNNIDFDNENILKNFDSDSDTYNDDLINNNGIDFDNENILENFDSDSDTYDDNLINDDINNDLINEKCLNNTESINNCHKNFNNTANKCSLESQLATWSSKNKITHIALNELLSILKPIHTDLPLDARVLMKTLKKITLKIVEPGHYYHFGLNNCVQKLSSVVTLKNI